MPREGAEAQRTDDATAPGIALIAEQQCTCAHGRWVSLGKTSKPVAKCRPSTYPNFHLSGGQDHLVQHLGLPYLRSRTLQNKPGCRCAAAEGMEMDA
jgi:hypothetical protein